ETVPKLTQATVLWNPGRPENRLEVKTQQEAGARLGVKVQSSEVRSRDELATQLDAIGWDGTQAILSSGDSILATQRRAIVEQAAKLRLPALYDDHTFVEAGGLFFRPTKGSSKDRNAPGSTGGRKCLSMRAAQSSRSSMRVTQG